MSLINIFVWFSHCNYQHSYLVIVLMRKLKCIYPTYTHTLSTHISLFLVQSVSKDRVKYELCLFSLATTAELNTIDDPVLVYVTPSNYQCKGQCIIWGQVPILIKVKIMAFTTLLCIGRSKEETVNDLRSSQAGRWPCERAVTPLPWGRVTPVSLVWLHFNYGNKL